ASDQIHGRQQGPGSVAGADRERPRAVSLPRLGAHDDWHDGGRGAGVSYRREVAPAAPKRHLTKRRIQESVASRSPRRFRLSRRRSRSPALIQLVLEHRHREHADAILYQRLGLGKARAAANGALRLLAEMHGSRHLWELGADVVGVGLDFATHAEE